jgi:hypothetical protein
MQKAEAIRYFGADAIWKKVGQRLQIGPAPIAPVGMRRMSAGRIGPVDLGILQEHSCCGTYDGSN